MAYKKKEQRVYFPLWHTVCNSFFEVLDDEQIGKAIREAVKYSQGEDVNIDNLEKYTKVFFKQIVEKIDAAEDTFQTNKIRNSISGKVSAYKNKLRAEGKTPDQVEKAAEAFKANLELIQAGVADGRPEIDTVLEYAASKGVYEPRYVEYIRGKYEKWDKDLWMNEGVPIDWRAEIDRVAENKKYNIGYYSGQAPK